MSKTGRSEVLWANLAKDMTHLKKARKVRFKLKFIYRDEYTDAL